jgi:hypothetical protein
VVIYFDNPSFEILVNEDVKAGDLEAGAFSFFHVDLHLLFSLDKWLSGDEALGTAVFDLLKEILGVYSSGSELFKNTS